MKTLEKIKTNKEIKEIVCHYMYNLTIKYN